MNLAILFLEWWSLVGQDCVCYYHNPVTTMGLITSVLPGVSHDKLAFHSSLKGSGLLSTYEAPFQFAQWVEETVKVWDFDCLCTAHNGILRSGARARLKALLEETLPDLRDLANKNARKAISSCASGGPPLTAANIAAATRAAPAEDGGTGNVSMMGRWSKDFSDTNCECG